jgi:NADPH:quinone reductase-like Zn-dependent oxidoreductase
MKAIVIKKYGNPLDALQLKEVEKPALDDDRVLVKVHAASVNPADLAPIKGALLARLLGTGLLKPKHTMIGTDIAGRVEAVGKDVKRFRMGDEVFGYASGGFAEYACAREDLLALKPANITFEQAASVPVAGITALQGLRKGQIQSGQKVLVYGASGGVGTFAAQIAKSFGAEVTAACSTKNLDQARALRADFVIDYTHEDFAKNGKKYDLIVAINGYRSILDYRNALRSKGVYIVIGGSLTQLFQALLLGPLLSSNRGRKMGFMGIAKRNQQDLTYLSELLEFGKIKPVIDKRYPLSETAKATQYLIDGHARGKIVINLVDSNKT